MRLCTEDFKMDNEKQFEHHKFGLIHFVIFVFIITSAGLRLLLSEQKKISETEKRELHTFPKYSGNDVLSGNYTKEIGLYVADQFPYRNGILSVVDDFKATSKNSDTIKLITMYQEAEPQETPDTTENKETETKNDDANEVGKMKNDLLVFGNKAYQLFGGSKRGAVRYAENINKFQNGIGSSIHIYAMVFPSPAEFYVKGKYQSITGSEKDFISFLYQNLDPQIKSVDAYSEMVKHTDEYLFFGTDHHWTARGAYYAYCAFCKTSGFIPTPLTSFQRKVKYGFLGTFASITRDESLESHPDSLEYFIGNSKCQVFFNRSSKMNNWEKGVLFSDYFNGGSAYMTFLCGDIPSIKIITGLKNSRRILVIKESYGNAFVPFLVAHFEEVFVADFRYFPFALDKFIEENKINEVLVMNNSILANAPYFGNKLTAMMHRAQTPLTLTKKSANNSKTDTTKSI